MPHNYLEAIILDPETDGEIEIEEEVAPASAAVRRPAPRAVEESEGEGIGILAACIVTTLIMLMALPLVFSVSSGKTSGIAEGIASIFYGDSFNK